VSREAPADGSSRRPRGARRPAIFVVVGGLLVLTALVAALLSASAPRLAGTNNARMLGYPVRVGAGEELCQRGERVPADAARVSLAVGTESRPGPRLTVTIGDERIRVPGGYRDLGRISVPLPPDAVPASTICVRNEGERPLHLGGQDASLPLPPVVTEIDGEPTPVVAQTLYFRAGAESWFAVAGEVVRRWGYVTALGSATPWIALALFMAAGLGACALAVRGRAGPLACAAMAVAAAGGWAFTTPAFHVPDEPQHVAYAQYLAETGKLPEKQGGAVFSNEEAVAFRDAGFNGVAGNPGGRPPWSADEDRALDALLAQPVSRVSEGGASFTVNNPPLYYALQAGPYWLASGGDFLDRLLVMRLVSVLLAGFTTAMAFVFVREVLPRHAWAWVAGALAVALQPVHGFISGGVNNDAGLFAAAAALCWLLARALRRGLTARTAAGIGLAFGIGAIVKATMVAFAPGLLACAAVLLWRSERRAETVRRIALAAGVAALPIAAYLVLNATIWDRDLWVGVADATGTPLGRAPSLREAISYLWQFYLPRLPFMTDQQVGIPLFNIWFEGFIGRYGWLDTSFPQWVYHLALAVFAVVLALAGAALWRRRASVRERRGELLVWGLVLVGFLAVIGVQGYRARLSNGQIFEQARYLLPLLAFYGGTIALAARGAGRRAGPAVAAGLVVGAFGHMVVSVLLVAGRFYG
jgi:hypothetical protein